MSVPKLYQNIMATFQKRGDKWRAIIRRANYPTISKTFATKKLAEEWTLSIEAPMVTGELEMSKKLKTIAVSALIRRYIAEITPTKKSAKSERNRLTAMVRNYPQLFGKPIEQFTKKDVIAWRDDRLKSVKPSSFAKELAALSVVFTTAVVEWSLPIKENPCAQVRKPPKGKPRNRRISDDEVERILDALGWKGKIVLKKDYVAWCFLFAIETAMRSGEILSLKWEDINGKIAHLRDTKNGSDRNVPLSSKARELIAMLPKTHDVLVPLKSGSRDALFRKARKKAGIDDLTFHDTRREALSRMAKKIPNPMDLAKISGHKDLKILMQVYYNPSNDHLADLLG